MKAGGCDWYRWIFLFFFIIMLPLCQKQETARVSKQSAPLDSARSNVLEMLNNQSDIERSINRIMKLIEEKEAELKKAQREIDSKSAELKQREEQLAKIEVQAKNLRQTSYFILAIGIVLIMIGLFLLLSRGKSETH